MGVLPIGYGTGCGAGSRTTPRCWSAAGGYPLVGNVSMDNITIDLGPETDVEPGDEAVLIGAQGSERILAEELARRLATINYEITSGISPRVPRRPAVSGGGIERAPRPPPRRSPPRAALAAEGAAWIVGGAVRDALLGEEVATSTWRSSRAPRRTGPRAIARAGRRRRLSALRPARDLARGRQPRRGLARGRDGAARPGDRGRPRARATSP